MQPVVPCIGSTRIAASSAAVRLDQHLDRGDVIVAADQKLERRIDRTAVAAEIEDPAVVSAIEDQDLRAAGDRARGTDRHQIGLVPELVKRTSSIDGKRAQTAAANRASVAPCAPKLSPPASAASIASRIAGCEWP